MSDTRNDYRFIVAEHAVEMLEELVRGKRLPAPVNWQRAMELVREAGGLVKRMRYSFMPPTTLAVSEEARRLQEVARELSATLFPREWIDRLRRDPRARRPMAEARYAIRVLYGLPARLALGDENSPFYAFDIECVRVLSVEQHPRAERLKVTRAQGRLAYTIVTNLEDVRRGEVRAAAILPPAEFMGVISEAMYCSPRLEGCEPGKRPPRDMVELGEIGAVLASIARRHR